MIRPTFLAFETAKRALSISQAGLDIVGHNISNAQTAGYTRQRVDQVSMTMNGISTKYQTFKSTSYGAGANFQGVNQIRDPYLDNRYRAEATVNGEFGVKHEGLTDINNIFDETMADGLSAKMSELLNSLTVLGQSANIKEHALIFRDTANQFVQILNKNATQLEEARAEQMLDLKISVNQDVNMILSKIADLNKKIKDDNFYGNPSNEFNDTRNMLLDNLSEYLDIKVVRTPVKINDSLTIEQVSVELNNSGDPPLKLVDGSNYNKIGVTEDPANGNAIVSLIDGISGIPIQDLTSMLTKGGLKGYIDVINGEGPNNENGANEFRGVPYYMKALDEYAQQFAEVLNRVNNITEQEALDSGASYTPVLTGSAVKGDMAWMESIEGLTIDFSGKNTNMEFSYDGAEITATFTDANGNPQIAKAVYTAGTDINFELYDNSGASAVPPTPPTPTGNLAFSVKTKADTFPPATTPPENQKTQVLIDAGWPPVASTGGNKNLIVPLSPTVTDNGTGEKPAWIDSIHGGVMQFSGKEYDIEFDYDVSGAMTAKIGNAVYSGSYTSNGRVEFRDDSGAVMFTVNTTSTPPEFGTTQTTVDATVTAKNIALSSNWREDPLYVTTTKSNAVNKKEATLVLEGTKNPVWLNKVSMGPDTIAVPNAAYQFYKTNVAGKDMINVKINGIVYSGEFTKNGTIALKGGDPEKTGLILETNHKDFGATDAENVATIRTDTGSINDNINKLLTEINRATNYSVSGISGGLPSFLTSFQQQMGSDKDLNTSLLDASMTTINTLANRRDSISAVSIDEEGINMMTYQNYYNAAARYMTTIDEALDKIINGMGAVGR